MHIRIEDRFHCLKETFVRLTFDEAFNTELHEFLGFRSRSVVRSSEENGQIQQRVEYETGTRVPWIVRKLVGRSWVAYWEEQVFDKESLSLVTEIEPMALKGRIESKGTMCFLDDSEPGWMRRTYDIDVRVAVPFAARPIANRIVSDVKQSYTQTAGFVTKYLKANALEGR